MKLLFVLLLCSLLLTSIFMEPVLDKPAFCESKCRARCAKVKAKAKAKARCAKYCNICCAECKCVPSGTYGHKHQCPCYRHKKNSKGKPKCP